MAYSINTKNKAIGLRKNGFSIKEIANKFHISQSTSSLWLRNAKVSENGIKRLRNRKILAQYRTSQKWQKIRIKQERINSKIAKKSLRCIKTDRDCCRLYAAILFWCEGGKADKTGVRFINSDPLLVKTFLRLFRRGFNIDEKRFHLLMHLHQYHNEHKQKLFWSSIAQVPTNQFNKTYIKKNTGKVIRANYPGCLAICYNDANILREIKALFKEFANKITAGVV